MHWEICQKPTDIVEENASGRSTPEEGHVQQYEWSDNEETHEEREVSQEVVENTNDDEGN